MSQPADLQLENLQGRLSPLQFKVTTTANGESTTTYVEPGKVATIRLEPGETITVECIDTTQPEA